MKTMIAFMIIFFATFFAEGSYLIYKPLQRREGLERSPLQRMENLSLDQAQGLRRQGFLVEKDQAVYLLQASWRRGLSLRMSEGGGGGGGTVEPPVWPLAAIRVPEAHQLPNSKGNGVQICMVDSGVNHQHPSLREALREGRSFVDQDMSDPIGHGTMVATLMVGRTKDFPGVAPEATLSVAKVVKTDGSSSVGALAEGFRWCMERGHIINLSLGFYRDSEIMKDLFEEARRRGITVVVAAGNDPRGILPSAQQESVISVGAANYQGFLSSFSSRGRELDLVAPGEQIPLLEPNGLFSMRSGTSLSAALVTGVEAIRRSRGAARIQTKLVSEGQPALIDAYETAISRK